MARLAAKTVVEILQDRARSIAERLKLDYEYRFTGYGDMEGDAAIARDGTYLGNL